MTTKNWAGNIEFSAKRWHTPDSIESLQEIVHRAEKIHPVGTRHSFNRVADGDGELISLEKLNRIVSLDREKQTVTFEAGIRYGELCAYLNDEGFALHNLASLVHIGVAGACATATHGSGMKNGCLSTAVSALEFVGPGGDIKAFSRESHPDVFDGLVVGLGGMGVVSKMTLDIEPAFQVKQQIYEHLPFAAAIDHFEEIMSTAYSVSLFTNWSDATINQVWLKHRVADPDSFDFPADLFGAKPASQKLHPVPGFRSESCTNQLGIAGDWHNRLQHFRLDFTPSAGDELQSEYLLPIKNAVPALRAINRMRHKISPILHTSEIRTVAPDTLWLSMAYQQQSVAIHFTWKPDWPAVKQSLSEIEPLLARLDARPHWGKLFTLPPEHIASCYKMMPAFRELMQSLDPEGKFRNVFLDQNILTS